jgi:hypothetical protein
MAMSLPETAPKTSPLNLTHDQAILLDEALRDRGKNIVDGKARTPREDPLYKILTEQVEQICDLRIQLTQVLNET